MADRVRWQLDGWLNGPAAAPGPPRGITLLRLVPDEVVPATGRQLGFWGGATEADERAVRALARLEGLLGPEAVTVPEWRGGRGPGEQVALVPAAAVDLGPTPDRSSTRRPATAAAVAGPPPRPSPAAVARRADPGRGGRRRRRDRSACRAGHGQRRRPPAMSVAGGPWAPVVGWAGPWPVDERWWDPAAARRRARFQVVTDDGTAHLLALEGGRWWVEATYD